MGYSGTISKLKRFLFGIDMGNHLEDCHMEAGRGSVIEWIPDLGHHTGEANAKHN